MKRLMIGCMVMVSFILTGCENSLTVEQQISKVIEENSSGDNFLPNGQRDDGSGNITFKLPDGDKEVVWYFANEEGELIGDEMYRKIQEYGWTGTFLEAEPWVNEDGDAGIKTRWENLSYNTDISELVALDSNSYEALADWFDDGGLKRLEDNFNIVEISRMDGDGQELSVQDAQDMNFTSWHMSYSWGAAANNSSVDFVLDYRQTS